MAYCHKCGTEISDDSNYCRKCGFSLSSNCENKNEKSSKNKTLWIIVIILGIIVISLGYKSLNTNKLPTGYSIKDREICPFECCVDDKYQIKECSENYKCVSNRCEAIDTDEDGLTDIEEKRYGTDIDRKDTDNDGLSDYDEVKIKNTNPLNPNTDNDRYLDGSDLEPLKANSAKVSIVISDRDKQMDWETVTIIAAPIGTFAACVGITGGTCTVGFPLLLSALTGLKALDKPLYSNHVTLSVSNTGDDYTSYFEYQIHLYTADKLVKNIPSGVRNIKIEPGQTYSDTLDFDILVKEVLFEKAPNIIKDFKNLHFDYRVESIIYEKFP